jgi:hypothetical protein
MNCPAFLATLIQKAPHFAVQSVVLIHFLVQKKVLRKVWNPLKKLELYL